MIVLLVGRSFRNLRELARKEPAAPRRLRCDGTLLRRSRGMKRFASIAAATLALRAWRSAADPTIRRRRRSATRSGDELLVGYVRTGGFAPNLQQLTVEADGDAELSAATSPTRRSARSSSSPTPSWAG